MTRGRASRQAGRYKRYEAANGDIMPLPRRVEVPHRQQIVLTTYLAAFWTHRLDLQGSVYGQHDSPPHRPSQPPISKMPGSRPSHSERTRTPLSDTTNSSRESPRSSRSPSPVFHTAKSTQPRQDCARRSIHQLYPDADSSEEVPSNHSSIYEASRCPSAEALVNRLASEDSKEEIVPAIRSHHARTSSHETAVTEVDAAAETANVTDSVEIASAIDTTEKPPVQGRNKRQHGVHLETITEQNSISTIRPVKSSARSSSLDAVNRVPTRAKQTPKVAEPTSVSARRPGENSKTRSPRSKPLHSKRSMSLDDLSRIDTEAVSPPFLTAAKPRCRAFAAIAGPSLPPFLPPIRLSTPVGVPSWTAAQDHSSHRHVSSPEVGAAAPEDGFRALTRRLFARRSVSSSSTGSPGPGVSVIATMHKRQRDRERGRARERASGTFPGAGPNRSSRAPRFRPGPSGHRNYGTIETHPFHHAPVARMPPQISVSRRGSRIGSKRDTTNPATPPNPPRRVRFTSSVINGHEARSSDEYRMSGGIRSDLASFPSAQPTRPSACVHNQRHLRVLTAEDRSTPRSHVTGRQRLLAFPEFGSATKKQERCWKCTLGRFWRWLCYVCCGAVEEEDWMENVRLAEQRAGGY